MTSHAPGLAPLLLALSIGAEASAQQDVPAGAITARSDVHLDLQSLPGTRREALQQLGAAVQAKMTLIRTCYDNAVRARPELAGDMRILLETGPRGTVTNATVAEDHLGSTGIARCVLRVLRNLGRNLPPTA